LADRRLWTKPDVMRKREASALHRRFKLGKNSPLKDLVPSVGPGARPADRGEPALLTGTTDSLKSSYRHSSPDLGGRAFQNTQDVRRILDHQRFCNPALAAI
jgi:hypothetical protein